MSEQVARLGRLQKQAEDLSGLMARIITEEQFRSSNEIGDELLVKDEIAGTLPQESYDRLPAFFF
jgi:hypothetical protein